MAQTWYILNDTNLYNAVVGKSGAVYSTQWAADPGDTVTQATNLQNLYPVGHIKNGDGTFTIGRAGIRFNTSWLSGLTPISGFLLTSGVANPGTYGKLCVTSPDLSPLSDPLTVNDYQPMSGANTVLGDSSTGVTDNGFLRISIGVGEIDVDGNSYYVLRHEHEISAEAPSQPPPTVHEYFEIYSKTGDSIDGMFNISTVHDWQSATLTLHIGGTNATPIILKVVVSEGSGEVYSNIDHRFYYYPNGSPGDIVYSDWQLNSPLFEDINWDITGLAESTGYTYGVEWRYTGEATTYEILGYFTTHAFNGIIYPTNSITRVTSIVRTFNRLLGEYKLQAGLGGVLAEFDIPTSVVTPNDVKAEEPPLVIPDVVPAVVVTEATPPVAPPFTFGGGDSGGGGATRTWTTIPKPGFIAPPIVPKPAPIIGVTSAPGFFWQPDTPQQTISKIQPDAPVKSTIVNTPEGEKRKKVVDKFGKTRSAGEQYE